MVNLSNNLMSILGCSYFARIIRKELALNVVFTVVACSGQWFESGNKVLKFLVIFPFFGHLGPSLVPRPYSLTRRNGLMSQVEFVGLAYAFETV